MTNLDLHVRIAADAARYAQGMLGASRETKKFADHARSELGSLKRELASLGMQLGAIGFAKHGLKGAADFQAAMLDVEGNIKTTTMSTKDLNEQLKAVRDTAVEVHKVMPYNTQDVVSIQKSLLKAGVSMDDIKEVHDAKTGQLKHGAAWSVAGLAALSDMAPEATADMMARIGSQFGLKGEQFGAAANTLMKADAASPGSLQEIMYTLKQFGSNAHTLRIGVDDSAVMAAMATPLGMEAGTAINRFLEDSIGKTKQQQKALTALGLGSMNHGKFQSAFFKDGQYIGIDKSMEMVRSHLGAIIKGMSVKDIVNQDGTSVPVEDIVKNLEKKHKVDEAKALLLASKAWGEEGARFALLQAMAKKENTFAGTKEQMGVSLGINGRMDISMSGFSKSLDSAKGTIHSVVSMGFEPFLGSLTSLTNHVNDAAFSAGQWLEKDSKHKDWVAGGMLAAGATAVLGPIIWKTVKGLRGGKSAGRMGADLLKGMGTDALALGQGVAMGKTLQAAMGVMPVFVVNMPGTGGMGGGGGGAGGVANTVAGVAGSAVEDIALGAAAGQATTMAAKLAMKAKAVAKLVPATARIASVLSAGELASMVGVATPAALLAGAGAVGYGVGTVINKSVEGTKAGDWLTDNVGGAIAKMMAWFGDEDAKKAVATTQQAEASQALVDKIKQTDLGGTLTIAISTPPGVTADASAKMNNMQITPNVNVGKTMDKPK